MSANFIQSKHYRNFALALLRFYSRILYWRRGERVFVNSIPKAGTHLLSSIIEEIPGFMNSRVHLNIEHVSQKRTGNLKLSNFVLNTHKLGIILDRINGGQFVTAHLPWSEQLELVLKERNFKIISLSRNSEAILISRLHYIIGLKRHHLHHQLTQEFKSFNEQLRALRLGFPPSTLGPGTESFNYILERFEGWKNRPGVLNLSFEELVGEKGGGDQKARFDAIERILTFLKIECDANMLMRVHHSSKNKKTATLRSGRVSPQK